MTLSLNVKVLEKCTKILIGQSRLAFNSHESNIDCYILVTFASKSLFEYFMT